MINHNPQCLHMYLYLEEDDDSVNEDDENEDENGHDDKIETMVLLNQCQVIVRQWLT